MKKMIYWVLVALLVVGSLHLVACGSDQTEDEQPAWRPNEQLPDQTPDQVPDQMPDEEQKPEQPDSGFVDEQPELGMTVEQFIDVYSSYQKGADYYLTHPEDYHCLYEVSMEDAKVTKLSDGTAYEFVLYDKTRLEEDWKTLRIETNLQGNIRIAVFYAGVDEKDPFKKSEEVNAFTQSVVECFYGKDATELFSYWFSGSENENTSEAIRFSGERVGECIVEYIDIDSDSRYANSLVIRVLNAQ